MSAVIEIESNELFDTINMLANMFPKGTTEMPVGFCLKDQYLTITCIQGSVYVNKIFVNTSDMFDITILYRDLSPLITKNMMLNIEHSPIGLTISGDNFTAEFNAGYSSIQEQTFSNLVFKDIHSEIYKDTLKDLYNMNLEKLYNITSPIIIRDGLAVQKYPNTIVQVRATGLPFNATVDTEHIKLLIRYNADAVSTDIAGTLVFRKGNSVLQIPCKASSDITIVNKLLVELGEPKTLHLGNYVDNVRQASKLDTKSSATIVFYEAGIKTKIHSSNTIFSVSDGNVDTNPLLICNYPIQLWLTFLKYVSGRQSQFLIGDDILCLRTTSMIILTRVLL